MHNTRPAILSDIQNILQLYKKVRQQTNGIICIPDEITVEYIQDFVTKCTANGLILVVPHPTHTDQIIAEIHAYYQNIFVFRHILTDLTILVDPKFQGQKIGKLLFTKFLETIKADYSHILRVELFVKENNTNANQFYKKLGFIEEGKHQQRIKNLDHSLETPIHMAWFNPNYNATL